MKPSTYYFHMKTKILADFQICISVPLKLFIFFRYSLLSFYIHNATFLSLKCALLGLRQILEAESPLKVMKNIFYFTSKALFVLKIFKFLPWFFGHLAKRLDKKDKINFKFYDVTAWITSNCNTHIAQYLEK